MYDSQQRRQCLRQAMDELSTERANTLQYYWERNVAVVGIIVGPSAPAKHLCAADITGVCVVHEVHRDVRERARSICTFHKTPRPRGGPQHEEEAQNSR